ncbi:MAG: ribosome biogenesis GTPase Der [Acidobacteria bacterium]|nr:ribosome biogenesis GTPase Der [Acidobacteriota bacterium]
MASVIKTVLTEPEDYKLPLVALVGRPNVGKSTLFNRLTHSRRAIVDPTPGMTRDRLYGTVTLGTRKFRLVDTGGIEENPDLIVTMIRQQTQSAILEADLLVLMIDGRDGLLASDEAIAQAVRTTHKPIIVFVNKVDGGDDQFMDHDIHKMGFPFVLAGSAEHNLGIFDLENQIEICLGDKLRELPNKEQEAPIRIAIIGKPNVGKSSLVNKMLREERVMVSPIAGTTRDPIDSYLRYHERDFCLIDTAGIRRKGRIEGSQEHMSVLMAQRQVDQADVIVMLMDAQDPGTQQDAAIAGIASQAYKPVIVAVNKWDLVEDKDTHTVRDFEDRIRRKLKFLEGSPFIFLSALTGQRVSRILDLAISLHKASHKRVSTSLVNQFLQDLRDKKAIPSYKGKLIKIFYMTQVEVAPPTFMAVINRQPPLHFSQERFLVNRLREKFGMEGVPIKLILKPRTRKEDV